MQWVSLHTDAHEPLTHKKAKKSSVSGLPLGKHREESLPVTVQWKTDGSDLLGSIPDVDLHCAITIGYRKVTPSSRFYHSSLECVHNEGDIMEHYRMCA